ncbi:MAG TPA: hypothetical protein VML91_12555 [Burkholderiales bacterium]|nr:hypothetical protein [Burkholderiales bacterium]
MGFSMKRAGVALLSSAILVTGCAAPGAERGFDTFGRGMANLILSPFMIVGGLLQGLAFLPYTVGMALDDLNRSLREAQAVTLDDSYRATFGVSSLADPRVDKRTGEVAGENFGFGQNRPEAMLEATHAFQRLLVSQGMPEERARHYVVVGDYTYVRSRGHLLVAVVYRHTAMEPFRVRSKETGIVTTLRPEQMGWRSAYERDVSGQVIDEVIDWAGIEYASLRQDRVVATLMVIAAESVKSGKRSPEYWQVENRWIAGATTQIMAESSGKVKRALALS